MKWHARIYVSLKPTVNDPQGLAIQGGLHQLGFTGVTRVRMGKYLEVDLDAPDAVAAREAADAMCRRLLANPVVEQFQVDVEAIAD